MSSTAIRSCALKGFFFRLDVAARSGLYRRCKLAHPVLFPNFATSHRSALYSRFRLFAFRSAARNEPCRLTSPSVPRALSHAT